MNHSSDKIVPETATQGACKHPELSILLNKIEQFEGRPLSPFLLHDKAISAMCNEIKLPRPTNISLLNEYEAVLEFSAGYDANRIMMSLQKVDKCFSLNVEVSCTVAGPDQLMNISWGQNRQ